MKKYTINNLYWENGQMYHCDTLTKMMAQELIHQNGIL